MIEDYLPRIKEALGITGSLEINKTDFGYVAVKGNWFPPKSTKLSINRAVLDLTDRVLHEIVLVIKRTIPLRTHNETDRQIFSNIGDSNVGVAYVDRGERRPDFILRPGETVQTLHNQYGHQYGFVVEKGLGLLYVAKALKPEFVEGNSFRLPNETK